MTSFLLAAGLAIGSIPAGAAQGLPSSISGTVPGGVEGVASAVLQDLSEKDVSRVPVAGGKFVFRNVAPGDYYVALLSASGQRIARSCSVALGTGAGRDASFDCPTPGPAPAARVTPTPAATTAGRGLGKTGWVLVGAAAVGITTAVVIATSEDEGAASPTR